VPRQNRRRPDEPIRAASSAPSAERREQWRGEDHVVRSVAGDGSAKVYRCPGCDQEIRAGLPHVVAWPADDFDAGARRHWHTACWAARDRREPGIRRRR
jgi:hypothetical protein